MNSIIRKYIFVWFLCVIVYYVYLFVQNPKDVETFFLGFLAFGMLAYIIFGTLYGLSFILRKRNVSFSINVFELVFLFIGASSFVLGHKYIASFSQIEEVIFIFFDLLLMTAVFGVVMFIACAVGRFILRCIKFQSNSLLQEFLFSFGIGMGVMGYGVLFLLSIGFFHVYSVVVFLGIAGMLSWRDGWLFFKECFCKKIQITLELKQFVSISVWVLILLLLGTGFISSLGTLLSGQWDTFHQYLTFPMTYVEYGRLVPFPYHPHWGFPQLGEMMYALSGILLGVKGAFILNYIFSICFIIAIGYLLYSKETRKSLVWPVAIVASTPFLITFYLGYLKIEPLYYFYFILLLILLKDAFSLKGKNNTHILILVGIFFGMLVSIKYTALLIGIAFAGTLLFFYKRLNLSFKKIVLCGFIVAVMFSPWIIKNVTYYESAFFPIMDGKNVFYKEVGVSCNDYFREHIRHDIDFLYSQELKQEELQILSNWNIFMKALLFKAPSLLNGMHPTVFLFLPFLVIAVVRWKRVAPYQKFLVLFSFLYFLLWLFFLSGQIWYLAPSLFIWLYLAYSIFSEEIRYRYVYVAKLFIIVVLFKAMLIGFSSFLEEKISFYNKEASVQEAYNQVLENYSSQKYEISNWHTMWGVINKKLKENSDAKIYSFLDTQGYFIESSHERFIPDFFGYVYHCFSENRDALDVLRSMSVRYILYDSTYTYSCSSNASNLEENLICKTGKQFEKDIQGGSLEVVFEEGNLILYEL